MKIPFLRFRDLTKDHRMSFEFDDFLLSGAYKIDFIKSPQESIAVVLRANHTILTVCHFYYGKLSNGPSYQEPSYYGWYEDGRLARIEYHMDDRNHRPIKCGPAYFFWSKNGELKEVRYFFRGKTSAHRSFLRLRQRQ